MDKDFINYYCYSVNNYLCKNNTSMVSVCIATYNGEKYIKAQLESILEQLSDEDEVIISDDASTDSTVSIIETFQDPRINIYKNHFRNVVKNFEFALMKATGDIIFLSDQDDIWKPEKVIEIKKIFQKNPQISLVLTNAEYKSTNSALDGILFFNQQPSLDFTKNILKNNFLGCTMAFRNILKEKIYPFPENLAMHDWWIGLNHIKYGKPYFINKPLIEYRRHENTVTTGKSASIKTGIKWRLNIIKDIVARR